MQPIKATIMLVQDSIRLSAIYSLIQHCFTDALQQKLKTESKLLEFNSNHKTLTCIASLRHAPPLFTEHLPIALGAATPRSSLSPTRWSDPRESLFLATPWTAKPRIVAIPSSCRPDTDRHRCRPFRHLAVFHFHAFANLVPYKSFQV